MTTLTRSRTTHNVPLLDLRAQFEKIGDEIIETVAEVFASQRFILGPIVTKFESAVAEYCRSAHAVGVSSGTDALLVTLMAEAIGPGDEVITSPSSFFATAGCIARTGATPVFIDIDPYTYNIDPALIEAKITPRTRAILPVHLFGQMADMDALMPIAERHGLTVIEDAAQAIGAELGGRRAGSVGAYGCFSLFPSKNLGVAGDGGFVTTGDPDRAERLRRLRGHGAKPKYVHEIIGGNFRLDAIQAAVAGVKLRYLDEWNQARADNARRYDRLFAQTGLIENGFLTCPRVVCDRHVFNQYVVRVKRRDGLRSFLADRGIGCEVYYPVPLHLQACFAHLGYREGELPESERAAAETLALPVYPELDDEQARRVVMEVAAFFGR